MTKRKALLVVGLSVAILFFVFVPVAQVWIPVCFNHIPNSIGSLSFYFFGFGGASIDGHHQWFFQPTLYCPY
jgi:hypothetical protein